MKTIVVILVLICSFEAARAQYLYFNAPNHLQNSKLQVIARNYDPQFYELGKQRTVEIGLEKSLEQKWNIIYDAFPILYSQPDTDEFKLILRKDKKMGDCIDLSSFSKPFQVRILQDKGEGVYSITIDYGLKDKNYASLLYIEQFLPTGNFEISIKNSARTVIGKYCKR
jgi:hypothetical protein